MRARAYTICLYRKSCSIQRYQILALSFVWQQRHIDSRDIETIETMIFIANDESKTSCVKEGVQATMISQTMGVVTAVAYVCICRQVTTWTSEPDSRMEDGLVNIWACRPVEEIVDYCEADLMAF